MVSFLFNIVIPSAAVAVLSLNGKRLSDFVYFRLNLSVHGQNIWTCDVIIRPLLALPC